MVAKKDASEGEKPKKGTPGRTYRGESEQYFPSLAVLGADGEITVGVTLKPGDTVTLADSTVAHPALEEN